MRWRRRTTPVGFAQEEPDRRAPFTGAVPSELPSFDFEVRCTVVWNASPAWQEKACREVVAHAINLLSNYSPTHADVAGTRLAADLAAGTVLSNDPPVRVRAEDVVVTVAPDQLELAQQHAQQLRQREVAAAGHEVERAELTYLKNTVFKNTASAALWWLRHHDYDVTKLSSVVEDLNRTVKIVAGDDILPPVDALITALDALIPDLAPSTRYETHDQLAKILDVLGKTENADALRSQLRQHSPGD
ncbi:hypothetical protein [Amycolatopsis sp. CB00013]|uniref:hypothetical protein n=1 Tax=Amycolatopsis sp. CB00013 TaxID=1703945 RepID=UPI001160ED23|nr:hypothetical protein [Amycolatopsis sp. CB00013]